MLDELNKTAREHKVHTSERFFIIYVSLTIVIDIIVWLKFDLMQLRGFEMLKAVYLEPNLFDMERDLITPTFKLKRPQLLKYYKVIENLLVSSQKIIDARLNFFLLQGCIDQLYTEAKGAKA